MSIWNKILVGLIIVASLGLLYAGMQALATHQYWRESAQKHEAKIDALANEIEQLKYGEVEGGNLGQRRVALFAWLAGRGRVWYNCVPQQVINPETAEVRVAPDQDGAHGVSENMTVFVFEAGTEESPGRFLGQFHVKSVADKQIAIEPSLPLTPEELAYLLQSKGPWTLRELLPGDRRDLFAELDEEALRKLLPKETVEQYLADDPPRSLRDYSILLKSLERRRVILKAQKEDAQRHKQHVETSLADAKRQVEFREVERAALKTELADMVRQRDTALAHQNTLEKELADRRVKIAQLLDQTRAVADEIARDQFRALEQIDGRGAVAAR